MLAYVAPSRGDLTLDLIDGQAHNGAGTLSNIQVQSYRGIPESASAMTKTMCGWKVLETSTKAAFLWS